MTLELIPETVRKLLASQPIELPIFHPVALKLQRMLSSLDFTVDEVAMAANEDPALASQMLKMANSPMYMGRTRVATIREVVIRLGAKQVVNIAIAASQASAHTSSHPVINRYMKELWQHSHGCALGSRWLTQNLGMLGSLEENYLAALLHDVGKLYLLKAVERLVVACVIKSLYEDELIMEVFKAMHVEQGVRLVQHWNFPPMYCDVIKFHHAEEWDPVGKMLAIMRLVNLACHRVGLGLKHEPDLNLLDSEEAAALDIDESQIDELLALLEATRLVEIQT